jgi:hypothetical protein
MVIRSQGEGHNETGEPIYGKNIFLERCKEREREKGESK